MRAWGICTRARGAYARGACASGAYARGACAQRSPPTGPTWGLCAALTVLRELGVSNIAAIEPALRTVSMGIPIKKLLLVAEMSAQPNNKELHPARFASTLQETGLLS